MAWQNCGIGELLLGSISANSSKFTTYFTYDNHSSVVPSDLGYVRTFTDTEIANMSAGSWIIGDENGGLLIVTSGSRKEVRFYTKNSLDVSYYTVLYQQNAFDEFSIFAGVNDETQRGTIFSIAKWRNDVHAYTESGFFNSDFVYLGLKQLQPILYTWQSVAGVYGKSGHVVFSHVLDDSILTGSDIEDLNADAFAFYGATCIDRLIANAPVGTEVTAFYSGDFNHLTVTKGELSLYVTLKMYVEGHIVEIDITRPANTDGWASGFLGYIIDSENQVAKLVYIKEQGNVLLMPTGVYDLTVPGTQDETTMGYIYTFLHGHTDDESENEDVNEADPGTDPEYQSDIGVTGISKPAYGAYDTGFTTQYRMTAAELKALASTLWSNNFWDNIKKFFEDPREIIIGVSLMPVTPDTGTSKEIKAGGISTGVYGLPLTDQYKFDTYGTCRVKAEKGNFLDYNPFTKVTAHLPFVGVHSLDVNDVMGKKLTLKYIFDFMTGCCVAEIDVNNKPRYFFGGSCGMQIPVSSEDFCRTYSSLLSAGATFGATLSTIATGGLTAPLAIGAASSMLSNGMNSSPTVSFASGGGAINGMIGCKTAFLIIERPKEKVADAQFGFVGKPSFITEKLNNCQGYTKCLTVHLDNIACTGQERQEIERLLHAGVRIESGSVLPEYTPSAVNVNSATTFLKCLSDDDVIGKTWSTANGDIVTIESKIMFDNDFLNPVLLVSGDFSAFNYAYIHELHRFYYIGNMVYKTGNMMEIHLKCDVLQSWKGNKNSGILSNTAIIERQESLNNAYFTDDMYWTQADKEVKTIPFLTSTGAELTFSIPADNYILTIAGGE